VTEGQSREPRTQRARLGAELRRVRALAGLSGRQIALATGISQPTVSRIERGESVASLREVTAWADAAGVGADRRALILGMAEAAVNEVTTMRARLSDGLAAVQEDVREREATARTLRNFQAGIIPGLLQTAEYARRILAFADDTAEVGPAVAARLARQEILHQAGRSFEFLLTEAALRYRPGPREVLTAQLDHLAAVVTLETISFGVIPADAEMHAITRCGFILYEDRIDDQPPFAIVETPHASLYANDPADIAIYRSQLAAFRQSAVYGAEALEVVHRIAHRLPAEGARRRAV
jgi:transcriptional regulator with XRE-family HTH domain